MSIYKITIKAGSPAKFDPSPLTAVVNDSVFWFNGDPNQSHWPAPSVANPTQWLDFQITPNTSSNSISFPSAKKYTYVCVNHPNETGTIIVKSAKKAAFGKKTKKGAFAKVTNIGVVGQKITGVVGKIGVVPQKIKKSAFGKITKSR
jgi:plastocyanin